VISIITAGRKTKATNTLQFNSTQNMLLKFAPYMLTTPPISEPQSLDETVSNIDIDDEL